MRAFEVDARYRAFVEANLALTLAEVQRDKDRREEDDARIQKWATVPDAFIDKDQTGTLTIIVGVKESEPDAASAVEALAGATIR